MILEEKTYKVYGYYPKNLTSGSHKPIIVSCDKCGKVRTITRKGYRLLCASCAGIGKRFLDKSGITNSKCLTCGKFFGVENSKVRNGGGKYCCHSCYAKSLKGKRGEETSRWGGGKVKRVCKECGNPFYVDLNVVEKGGGIYCCHPCYSKSLIGRKHSKEHIAKNAAALYKGGRRVALAKNKAKRKRDLGYTLLMPLKTGEDGHHITNEYVIGIPAEVHQKLTGGSREKHRTNVLLWLKNNDKKKYLKVLCVLASQHKL